MPARYIALIDGIDYSTIEDYLVSPTTPIQYILHTRKVDILPQLAAYLDLAIMQGRAKPEDVRGLLLPWIDRGDLLVTTTRPLLIPLGSIVQSTAIPADTYCRVIYLPPFYLSHTENLFEAIKAKQGENTQPPAKTPRIKP